LTQVTPLENQFSNKDKRLTGMFLSIMAMSVENRNVSYPSCV